MKTKQIEIEGKKITVWKMNFGFRSDFQGDISETTFELTNGKKEKVTRVDNGKTILYTLLYGIYESSDLGINPPRNIELGFTPEEKEARLKIIRMLEIDTSLIYDAINEVNTEVEEEVIKK